MSSTSSRLDFNRVAPIFLLTLVDVLGLTLILPLLHLYAISFGASPLEIGVVVAAFPLSQLIGLPVMGALSDRYGRKPLLLISQFATCIGFLMLGMANSLALVILSRLVDGIFGANLSTAQAALSDVTDDSTRAQGLGLIGAAFGLGFIFGPVMAIGILEFSDNLAMPAFVAAGYSLLSIGLTLFMFRETLPPEKRQQQSSHRNPFSALDLLRQPQISALLLVMFAQQVVFFGFESLLGLFTLSRLGLLGQGNALIFSLVGAVLVTVQARYIGRWSRRYGEVRLMYASLALLAVGLLLFAFTPEQPHPLYVQRVAENHLREQAPSGAESIIGDISTPLPPDTNRGFGGLLWVIVAILPISVGAGLIRPSINTLLTRQVSAQTYGRVLGLSASVVSLANGFAPLLGGGLFQQYGETAPFLLGGLVMAALVVASLFVVKPTGSTARAG